MVGTSSTCLHGVQAAVLFVWAFAIIIPLIVAASTIEEMEQHAGIPADPRRFLAPELTPPSDTPCSQEWVEDTLPLEEAGKCNPLRRIYPWRNFGWGSNLNQILRQWVQDSIFKGTTNFGINVAPSRLPCNCSSVAHQAVEGWYCLFKTMPRLCVFDDENEIQAFLDRGGMLDEDEIAEVQPPKNGCRDTVETAAALLKYIYSYAQPWFANDIQALTTADDVVKLRSGRYIALHVRRGDKILQEAGKIEVHVYLQAAALYLWQSSGNHAGVNSVSGIFVSSDDSGVLAEVQAIASDYFPNVTSENIVTISFRNTPAGNIVDGDELPTKSNAMTYELYVGLHAELQLLSEGDVFVGTFSSNIARLVYLMRETNGLDRNSTMSVDKRDWNLH